MSLVLAVGCQLMRTGSSPLAGGGAAIPANAMLYPDGTPMKYPDGSYMLYPSTPGEFSNEFGPEFK